MNPEEYSVISEQINRIEDECHQMLFEFSRASKFFSGQRLHLEAGVDRLAEDIHSVDKEDLQYIFNSM